jgi:hypothetical protein
VTSPTKAPQPHGPGRPRRLGLYGPFAALAIALIGWGAGWLWTKGRIERDLDATAARMKAAGGAFAWSARRIRGYPFRFDIDFSGLTWRSPDGWGVSTPELRSETSVFAFGHWIAYAPEGVSLIRPKGGAVRIAAQILRASVSDAAQRPPTFSLEGQNLSFTPATGAASYPLASAGQLHLHTRAGPNDQGAFLIELDEARATPGSKLAAVAAGAPVSLAAEIIYDHASAMSGLSWTPAMKSWAIAGGKLRVRRFHFQAGSFAIHGHGAGLTLDPNGRLAGELGVVATWGEAALSELASSGVMRSDAARSAVRALQTGQTGGGQAVLTFRVGRMLLGPVALGRSPKVY